MKTSASASKPPAKRAKTGANSIASLLAKQVHDTTPVSSEKTTDGGDPPMKPPPVSPATAGTKEPGTPTKEAERKKPAGSADKKKPPPDTTGLGATSRKRKDSPPDAVTKDDTEAGDLPDTSPPPVISPVETAIGAKMPSLGDTKEDEFSGLTFHNMWEEFTAKAPNERNKVWIAASQALNAAITEGDPAVIQQTMATWRVHHYGTNFAVVYRDNFGFITLLHALDTVQAGVLGFEGGELNPTTVKVVAVPLEKWRMIEMPVVTAAQALKGDDLKPSKNAKLRLIPTVRALTPDQLGEMIPTIPSSGIYRYQRRNPPAHARDARDQS